VKTTDVLVIGGGPAGGAAALAAVATGATVTLLERSAYNAARVGESLPPDAASLLQRLGVWETFLKGGHLPSPGILSAWARKEPYENDFLFNPYGNGWHVDRRRFDAMLSAAAEERGAVVRREAHVIACAPEPARGWRVGVRSQGRVSWLRASLLIDASGRACWLARRLGARRLEFDHLVGVVRLFRTDDRAGRDARLLLEAAELGWWYSACLPEDRIAVAYMTDIDLLPRPAARLDGFWEDRLRKTRLTWRRLESAVPLGAPRTVAANSYRMERVVGEDWLALGDAAMAWDPLSSQGVSKALESAITAVAALGEGRLGRPGALAGYGVEVAQAFEDYRRLHARYYGQVRRWPESPFWQRRRFRP
jgi:flavin-dependent dehydrogenase